MVLYFSDYSRSLLLKPPHLLPPLLVSQAAVERMVGLENGISVNRNLSTEKKEEKGEEEETEDSFATPTATAPPPPPPLFRANA